MSCNKNTPRGCCFSRNENGEAEASACVGCQKMEVWDWLAELPDPLANNELLEIQFKNTRKGYFLNANNLELKKGDIVAVETSPGHDIGIVSLTGEMVTKQMKKTGFSPRGMEFKKIFRKAKPYDIEKWQEAIALEHPTMIRSRQISAEMGLNMKIGDVEYQGDRLKAIFYYIADERVDFRELIKVLAEQFRIRVEMKQIGARQEAGRIGGISACGRELCCATWINNFSSVTIGAARHQEISLNPQKLAGQCGKLKCCLNYELDTYIEAQREFPRINAPLETMDGSFHLVKCDTLNRVMWFSPDPHSMAIMRPLTIDRVRKILELNRKGIKADRLEDTTFEAPKNPEPEFKNVVGEDSITRFDRSEASGSGRNNRGRGRNRDTRQGSRRNNDARDTENQRQDKPFGSPDESNRQGGERRNRPPRGETGRDRRNNTPTDQDRHDRSQRSENGRPDIESRNDRTPRDRSVRPSIEGEGQQIRQRDENASPDRGRHSKGEHNSQDNRNRRKGRDSRGQRKGPSQQGERLHERKQEPERQGGGHDGSKKVTE